ncbi:c-type cytochrome [Acuticoccus sp. I52.16.1]|uniref:c-type cytochrome n=1 Tax=Acuticoccus sp. I52.16.1 TaxID=2928472 RepID=UPI001FD578AC|nr:c-type cytochrome [Acuticoccus sp. I52.16.1]UOM35857.1 cytochrome c [Acuticoccus sp. I52.16.1]
MVTRSLRAAICAAALLGPTAGGVAQERAAMPAEAPRVAHGRTLAETWCARCHAIGAAGQAAALADAPSFATLAASPGLDAAHLARVLVAPHPVMPQFPLAAADLAALEAYMRSLPPPR